MKIAYNPKTAAALTAAPNNNDITFDLSGLNIFVKGETFRGTDTTYSVFKKHTSSGNGGYDGLVPVPSYTQTNVRFLREDGTWVEPDIPSFEYKHLTNQNLNDLKDEGIWYYAETNNTTTNKPDEVTAYELYVGRSSGNYKYQKIITYDGVIWYRFFNSANWSAWINWATTDYRVLQQISTTANFRPVVLGYEYSNPTLTGATVTNQVYVTPKIYAQPSTGTLYAQNMISGGKQVLTEHQSLANYVTELDTEGKYVIWKRGSVSNQLTVPYAIYSTYSECVDTRDVNNSPTLFNAGARFQFKTNTTDGLNDGGTYHGILHFRPYGTSSDISGGPTHQLGFAASGNLHIRTSTNATAWGAWQTILTDTNYKDILNLGDYVKSIEASTNSKKSLIWTNSSDHEITIPYATAANQLYSLGFYNWANLANLKGNGIAYYADTSDTTRWGNYAAVLQFSNTNNPVPGTSQHWVTQLISQVEGPLGIRWRTNEGAWTDVYTVLTTKNYTNYVGKTLTITKNDGTTKVTYNGSADVSIALTRLYKTAEITANISNDTGTLTPKAMNDWTKGQYVTALDVSGNYLTWTKNGDTKQILVPYATKSIKLGINKDQAPECLTYYMSQSFVVDSTAAAGAWGMPSDSQDATNKNGQCLRMNWSNSYYTDLLTGPNAMGNTHGLYFRQIVNGAVANGSFTGGWRLLLDSYNYTRFIKSAERRYAGAGTSSAAGWYRIGKTNGWDSYGVAFIICISRTYQNTNNESYTFAVNISFQGHCTIKQISGICNVVQLDQIRVTGNSNSGDYYFDIHVNSASTNQYSWIAFGQFQSSTQWEANPSTFTNTNTMSTTTGERLVAFNHTSSMYSELVVPSLSAGSSVVHRFGVNGSTYNRGYMSFYYAGSGSTSNRISFGLVGQESILQLTGAGDVVATNGKIYLSSDTAVNGTNLVLYTTGGRLCAGRGVATGFNAGSLLVSNAWSDASKVPTNGIYSIGEIQSLGGFKHMKVNNDAYVLLAGGGYKALTDFERGSDSNPVVLWCGKVYRSSMTESTWYIIKEGGCCNATMLTNISQGTLQIQITNGAPMVAYCSTTAIQNSTSVIYTAKSVSNISGRSFGMGDYMTWCEQASDSIGLVYIRKFAQYGSNTDGWTNSELGPVATSNGQLPTISFYLVIIGKYVS